MKKPQRLKNSMMYSWILSYILILLIPLVITGFLFVGINRIVYQKITLMNESILRQIQSSLDNMFESIYKNGLQIEFSNEVAVALNWKEADKTERSYLFYDLQQSLKPYATYNDYIQDVAVYFSDSDYVVTSKSAYSSGLIETFFSQYNLLEEQWEFLQQIGEKGFYILPQGQGGERLVYAVPLRESPGSEAIGSMVIFPEERFMAQKIHTVTSEKDREVLLVQGEMAMSLTGMQKEYDEMISGDRQIRSVLDSEIADMQYTILDSYGEIYKEIRQIHRLVMASIVISVGVGMWCALYFSKKNYSPINTLIASVSGKTGTKRRQDVSEYRYLSDVVSKAIDDQEELERQLSLLKMLRGRPVSEKLRRRLFTSENYVVLVLAVEDSKGFLGEESQYLDSYHLLYFTVSNCIQDFFAEAQDRLELLEIDRYFVQIMGFPNMEKRELSALLWDRMEKLHEFFNSKLKIKLSISMGSSFTRPEDMAASYEQAKEALEYRMMMGNNVVIDSENLSDFSLSYDYSIENEKDIINSLKTGNFEQARDLLFQVIDSNMAAGMMSVQLVRCMIFDLVGTIIKALSLIKLDNNFLGRLDPVERLGRCETFEQIKDEFSDILSRVCDYIHQNAEDPNQILFDRVIGYVEEHYMDEGLNVSTLAAGVFVSKSFLVKLFKDHLGQTPLDYINRFRCERGLALLGEQRYTIQEIAEKIGYGNVHTFIRIFKKIYGRTPGAYRTVLFQMEGEEEENFNGEENK